MKNSIKLIVLALAISISSCGDKEKKEKDNVSLGDYENVTETEKSQESTDDQVKPSERVDLTTKGVGPIKELTLTSEIDEQLAAKGKGIFDNKCSICHKLDIRFIGPSLAGITEKRSPEWIMNMILNPEEMVQKDPLAKEVLIEFNGAPMANQGLSEDEARSILEYLRTTK